LDGQSSACSCDFCPYIPLNNAGSEESAYSVLVSYIPFRVEDEIIAPEFNGSAIAALNSLTNSSNLPEHVQLRLGTRLNRERLRESVNAVTAGASIFNETLNSAGSASFDLDAIPGDLDIDAMESESHHDDDDRETAIVDESEQSFRNDSTELVCDDVVVSHTADRELFSRLSNSLVLLKESFHAHKNNGGEASMYKNTSLPFQPRQRECSTIPNDMETLRRSVKQSSAYCLARTHSLKTAFTITIRLAFECAFLGLLAQVKVQYYVALLG
jgi:hypothetical protein